MCGNPANDACFWNNMPSVPYSIFILNVLMTEILVDMQKVEDPEKMQQGVLSIGIIFW